MWMSCAAGEAYFCVWLNVLETKLRWQITEWATLGIILTPSLSLRAPGLLRVGSQLHSVMTNRRRLPWWSGQWEARYHVKVHRVFCLSMGSGIKLTREELTLTQILNMNSAANLYNSLILSSGKSFVENGVLYFTIGYHFSVWMKLELPEGTWRLSTEGDRAFLSEIDSVGNIYKWLWTAFVECFMPE